MCPACLTTIATATATGGVGLLAVLKAIRAFTRRHA